MRMKLLKIVVVLLLAGSGDARPQKTEAPVEPESPKSNAGGWKVSSIPRDVREDSSALANNTQRQLKDLQYMDQSLRTVATQLLNVTSADETPKIVNKDTINKLPNQKQSEKGDVSLIKEVNSEISSLESMGIGFGRPINSKFGYFESSHPGQAMAMTEEELEKEMSSTRLITAYKNRPTTTGGISTWILLNPPSTTIKSLEYESTTKQPVEIEAKPSTIPMSTMEVVETTEKTMEKLTPPVATTILMEEVTTSTKKPVIQTTRRTMQTDSKPEKLQNTEKSESTQATTLKVSHPTTIASSLENREVSSPITTTKKVHIVRVTSTKPKGTTPKTTAISKLSTTKTRPNQQGRPKPSSRRTTIKPDITKAENSSTAKIEKVTFRPVQMISTPKTKTESTEKPMFVTKIKASILMDTQKATATPLASSTASLDSSTTSKPISLSGSDLVEVPVKSKPTTGTKVNNVLKVQLKKPLDETTKIEIEPIKVNAPVLKIEKVDKDDKKTTQMDKEADTLDDTRIDLKFDFNPELTKINVETSSEASSSTTSTTTTTKRPRHNSKRKKNKVRRRKPSSTTVSTSTTTTPATLSSSTENEPFTEISKSDIEFQESKIAPETKVAANSTKTKKKTPQKPISTQIYNFLSREVMPSFGVMSLVGLGLGLASYFLYPFGGAISRRNYEVEPKYKYNLDEYGGNYGQSEEEVLAKVLQGMTTDENKYPGAKDHDNNYYRYQHYDGAYDSQTKRRNDQRYTSSSSPLFRPETTSSILKYRNTDYRYLEASSTPNYYDRSHHPEYVVAQDISGPANRQFVVGSVPKEYSPYDEKSSVLPTPSKLVGNLETTESGQTQFERDIAQNFNFPPNPINPQNYANSEAQTPRNEDGYDEIEISPTAVVVEHGPRSLKVKRSVSRRKRESVIQLIPTKRELEEEEKEENLSNEILDIIDSALPGEDDEKTKTRREDNEVEDLEAQRRKKEEEEKTRLKESTLKTLVMETTMKSVDVETSSQESSSSTTAESIPGFSVSMSSISTSTEKSTKNDGESSTSPKSTDETTPDWIDMTTKRPEENSFNLFNFVKRVAEVKFRLGLTLLKHASEGFARYLGHVQKRINGEE